MPWIRFVVAWTVLAACSQAPPGPDREPKSSANDDAVALEPCERGRWCWVHGVPIRAIHGTTADGVFAVGAAGTILEWMGDRWHAHEGVTEEDVSDVFVASKNDVWIAAGPRGVVHYDGHAWTAMGVAGYSLSGSGPDDVWVGTQHYDNSGWTDLPHDLVVQSDLLVLGRDDVWVVGLAQTFPGSGSADPSGAVVKHYDGHGWQQVGPKLGDGYYGGSLQRVRGELWVQSGDRAWHYTGSEFVAGEPPAPTADEPGGIAMYDGRDDFLTAAAETQCAVAWRADANAAWCFGNRGQLWHFDGSDWSPARKDRFGATLGPADWGRVPPRLWAGNAELAWGSGPEHVFRVRPDGGTEPYASDVLELYDGQRWNELARGGFRDISGSSADNVWFVESGLLHHDGKSLERVMLPAELGELVVHAVHTFGPRATWVVAQRSADRASLLLRYDGEWSIAKMEWSDGQGAAERGITLLDVVGSADDDLWLFAVQGLDLKVPVRTVLDHYDGRSWQRNDLWAGARLGGLEVHADRLLLRNTWGDVLELPIASLPVDAESKMPAIATPPNLTFSGMAQTLWVGATDLWLTNSAQAMRRPL
jgi:hypothetical protein